MKFLRGLALALSGLFARPAAAAREPLAVEDPASYLHVEVHAGAHQGTHRPATPEELAEAARLAEAHWSEFYRDLAEELARNTRRAKERMRQEKIRCF